MELNQFLIGILIFVILDSIFLGLIMKNFWKSELKDSMRSDISLKTMIIPAIITYLLLSLAINVFVLPNAKGTTDLITFGLGCLMGLIIYGVFDLTNYIIIKNYTLRLVFVDIAWGSLISGLASLILSKL